MNKKILIAGLLILIAVSACYKDKGNYDYKNVNDFKVTITPAPTDKEFNIYVVNQPGIKAETFKLTAEVTQTVNTSEDNIEYTWYRTLKVDKKTISSDTIYGQENLMEIVASKKTEWDILLVVRDKSMELEYYRSITVKTKIPFYNSWLFVHGKAGERKLGALSWNTVGDAEVTPDIMEAMGQPGYPNMTGITYTNCGAENYQAWERLFIISAPDSVTYIYPFNSKVMGRYHQMGIANSQKVKDIITMKEGHSGAVGFINNAGKLFYTEKEAYLNAGIPRFTTIQSNVAENYKVDLAYVDSEGTATMWDNTNKRLMCYYKKEKGLSYIGTLTPQDLLDKEALWLGRDAISVNGDNESMLFIAKNENNNKCYLYHISFGGKDGKMTKGDDGKEEESDEYGIVTCDSTHSWGFTKNTRFAVSDYYSDQIFFTEGGAIYRGIFANGEKIKLYDTKGTIKQIAFRNTNTYNVPAYTINMRILGILVTNADGTDEIHEIHISNGGDVEEKHVYDLGDVNVIDWDFTSVVNDFERL